MTTTDRPTRVLRYVVLGDHGTCRDWLRDHGIHDREAIVITRSTRDAGVKRLVGLAGPVEVVRLSDYPSWPPHEHIAVERYIRDVNAEEASRP